jgi:hypothetical protein
MRLWMDSTAGGQQAAMQCTKAVSVTDRVQHLHRCQARLNAQSTVDCLKQTSASTNKMPSRLHSRNHPQPSCRQLSFCDLHLPVGLLVQITFWALTATTLMLVTPWTLGANTVKVTVTRDAGDGRTEGWTEVSGAIWTPQTAAAASQEKLSVRLHVCWLLNKWLCLLDVTLKSSSSTYSFQVCQQGSTAQLFNVTSPLAHN